MEQQKQQVGKVWLVGAGPSDGGLFTLKGKALLQQADVVVYDKLVGQGVMALIPPRTQRINVGKTAGNHPIPQEQINSILLEEALKGKKVVRLKGGDPFVFGRGGEELELLCQHHIPFEVVPGVTSAISVPAYNGIPVTHRDICSSLHIITGHTKKEGGTEPDYPSLVKLNGTMIFLMGVGAMERICQGLLDAGMEATMPAAVLERGTTAHQRRVVSDIAHLTEEATKAKIQTPAIIVVGKVCALAQEFHWAEDRPLGGLKIAVTRPRERSSVLAEKLSLLGAEVVLLPTIETEPMVDNKELKEVWANIRSYGWIAFTSPTGVHAFYESMVKERVDIRSLSGIQFAAIGEGTKKAIEERGIMVDLMPQVYSGEALGKLLARELTVAMMEGKNCRLLLPRAKIGTDEVIRPLKEANIRYIDLPMYDTITADQVDGVLYDDSMDYVAFTSASTVRGFVELHPSVDYTTVHALCIGEQTGAEAQKHGMQVLTAQKATMDSMVDCLLERKVEQGR